MSALSIRDTSMYIIFSKLEDPRRLRNRLYTLADIVCTAILAVLCRAGDYEEIHFWTAGNLDWLRSIGLCLNGAPSHDTYERFFRLLNHKYFESSFAEWASILKGKMGLTIAIDGKTLCNSRDGDRQPIHLVSAFATDAGLVLGQTQAPGKGGELAAIQELLDLLDFKGSIVTIDAGGCHRAVVEKLVSKKADYVITLKGNQGKLHAEASNFFQQVTQVTPEEADCDYWKTEEYLRGRTELREVWSCDKIDWLPQLDDWAGLKSLVFVRRTTTEKNVSTTQERYFITSLESHAEHLGRLIRGHWGVENGLHWQLDVTYDEDRCKIRKDNGPKNFSVLRRATLNMLRQETSKKTSIKNRRFLAGISREYLYKVMGM